FNNRPQNQLNWIANCLRSGDFGPNLKLMMAYVNAVPEDACDKYLGSLYCISRDGGYTFERPKKSPVSSPHGPFRANDGRIIWVGREFEYKDPADEKDYSRVSCAVMNENEDFEIISSIPPCTDAYGAGFACEPHAIQLPGGRILVAIRVQRTGEHPLFTVYLTHSDDGGGTFAVPVQLIPDNAGSPPHFLLTGSGLLVMSYACRSGNYGIRARISEDGGETFGEEIKLTENAPSPDLGYPAAVERKDGSLLTVWYEREEKFSVIKQMIWRI
ncbi:MAG: exo-alpha-sialidase, partial [Clostridia bacterium]|nr:exo-alpha-sialidase [Clostridia bacterium]